MRRLCALVLVAVVGLALVGCGNKPGGIGDDAPAITITKPMLDAKGTLMKDDKGNYLTTTETLSVEGAHYRAWEEANKPIFEMQVPPGQQAILPAGTKLLVRVPGRVEQFVPGWVMGLREGKSFVQWLAMGWVVDRSMDVAEKAVVNGGTRTYNLTTQGDGSGINSAGGNVGNPTTTVSPTSTTTTTTTGVEASTGQ
jgi:hypothetical protein